MRRSAGRNQEHRAAYMPDSYGNAWVGDAQEKSDMPARPGYSDDPFSQDAQYAYGVQNAQPPRNVQPDPFYQDESYADTAPYPDAAYQQPIPYADGPYARRPYAPQPKRDKQSNNYSDHNRRRNSNGPWLIIALVSGLLLALGMIFISNAYGAYAPFRRKAESTKAALFAQGVIVDGVSIGGMTRAQAETALAQSETHTSQALQMTIRIDDSLFRLTQSDVPFERNTQAVLDQAYAIGRQNSVQTLNSAVTPMEWRYQVAQYTAQNNAYLYTQVTYDKADVHTYVNSLAASVDKAAADAMVATFDFNTRSFTFTDEVYGAKLDTTALYDALISQLDSKNYSAVIQTATASITPSITRVELMNTFTKISSYTTTTTADYNRNTNIVLAAAAVNGTVLNAGETFSFNSVTGQRTAAKGYLEAAAIAGGTTTVEIGGGVCQVSSTIFNAAMMADLTLVSRSPHTWPSTYVDPGRDATVNWPNLDFQFKNQRDTPIFIVCYFSQGKSLSAKGTVTVEIYGVTLGTGLSIDLKTKLISTQEPPAEAVYQRNTTLAPGTEQVLKKARTGYVYETYRVYLRNGSEYRRELLCTSTYKMIQQVIEYN